MNEEEKGSLDSIWASICLELQQVISADSVACWFQAVKLVSYVDRVLTLRHGQSIHRYWIEENYLPQLITTASSVLGESISIVFQSDASVVGASVKKVEDRVATDGAPQEVVNWASECGGSLAPELTFETFEVGMNNRFAATVAKAVAESPSHTYNPLFIYGKAGMGKTHLMHAIGNLIQQNKKYLKVLYVTGEKFVNDYASAIQRDELARFRERYHQADVLLIDDIKAIAFDYRARGEFYHLCNILCDDHKQIVLSSDSPPPGIENCERRLDSCSELGVIAELHLPEKRTRLAILRNQLNSMPEKFRENVSDEVLNYIVWRIETNVRCLKDALCQVVALAFLKGKTITVAEVEENLRNFLQREPPLNVLANFHANLLAKPVPQLDQLILKS
jgi:chromosomal replication initiator protein